ncbi:response regulator transcription factor [Oceanobacillus locisalsi]|uniref:Response regulator n=1 Tax=Oceanobacillus locisalsi TaxID=546107 RepID=A0ABW3NP63_9BACI
MKVLIVDDHYLVGEGTKTMLESDEKFTAKYVSTGEEALSLLESFDIYIIDIHMPDMSGIELSKKLLEKDSKRIIILYTGFDNQATLSLFTDLGIKGIINKTATKSELINLIHYILDGQTLAPLSIFKDQTLINSEVNKGGLNERELNILKFISDGLSNKQIADELFLSDRAVEYQLSKLYKILNVKNRGEAISTAIHRNLLD